MLEWHFSATLEETSIRLSVCFYSHSLTCTGVFHSMNLCLKTWRQDEQMKSCIFFLFKSWDLLVTDIFEAVLAGAERKRQMNRKTLSPRPRHHVLPEFVQNCFAPQSPLAPRQNDIIKSGHKQLWLMLRCLLRRHRSCAPSSLKPGYRSVFTPSS